MTVYDADMPEEFTKNEGRPLFPTTFDTMQGPVTVPGASLRDVFAMSALQGLLAAGNDGPSLTQKACAYADEMMRLRDTISQMR